MITYKIIVFFLVKANMFIHITPKFRLQSNGPHGRPWWCQRRLPMRWHWKLLYKSIYNPWFIERMNQFKYRMSFYLIEVINLSTIHFTIQIQSGNKKKPSNDFLWQEYTKIQNIILENILNWILYNLFMGLNRSSVVGERTIYKPSLIEKHLFESESEIEMSLFH